MEADVVAVLVAEDLFGRRAVGGDLSQRDDLVPVVAAERPMAAQLLHLGERRDPRRHQCELGPVGQPDEELGPLLRRLGREQVGDEDVNDLARRRGDRAAAPRDRRSGNRVDRAGGPSPRRTRAHARSNGTWTGCPCSRPRRRPRSERRRQRPWRRGHGGTPPQAYSEARVRAGGGSRRRRLARRAERLGSGVDTVTVTGPRPCEVTRRKSERCPHTVDVAPTTRRPVHWARRSTRFRSGATKRDFLSPVSSDGSRSASAGRRAASRAGSTRPCSLSSRRRGDGRPRRSSSHGVRTSRSAAASAASLGKKLRAMMFHRAVVTPALRSSMSR